MAAKTDYSAGLATLAAGGTTVTFSGGANITAADIQPGDTFKVQNLDAIIAAVTDATHVELTVPWTGTALAAAPYRIRFQPDGSRYTAALRDLVAAIGGGSLAALQAVTGATDTIAYFNSATTMATTTITAQGRTALANITAAGNALLDDANASAQLSTLGFSAFFKTLIDDANGAAMWASMGATQNFPSSNGWIRFPGGVILQWGASGSGEVSVNFPTAFSAFVFPIVATCRSSTSGSGGGAGYDTSRVYSVSVETPTVTGFTARPRYRDNTSAGVFTGVWDWFALGI